MALYPNAQWYQGKWAFGVKAGKMERLAYGNTGLESPP